jgi:choline dehydrogenase-like flavoprotein
VAQLLGRLPNPDDLTRLRQLLGAFEIGPVNLVLSGNGNKFSTMALTAREKHLRSLAGHRLSLIRGGMASLKRLAALAYYSAADANGLNPTWPALNYPGPIVPRQNLPKTIHPIAVTDGVQLDCDVVIVGSGAGGGVVAAELAAAGHDVVVVEKGGYFNEADFNGREMETLGKLYLGGGLITTRDQGVILLAGSCLGGGTVINYSTSFRTPDSVLSEWAQVSGLDFFVKDEFRHSLDAVGERLRVNQDHNQPSRRDELMSRGLKACGWHVDRMPRNVSGCTQDEVCGYCGLGCVRGAKQSMLKTYLQDAFDRRARLVVDCSAERVIVEKGRAVGIAARTRQRNGLTVRARAVVVAAGAIESPALLLRSGLEGRVGQNLVLHPSTGVWGHFREEVRPWSGTLQAVYSDQFANLTDGYGAKFETVPVHPGFLALGMPWEDAGSFDQGMRLLSHTSVVGILLRDRFGGRVTVSRRGIPIVDYQISKYDQRHVRQAVEGAARVLLAAGAQEMLSIQPRRVSFKAGGGRNFEDWLARVDAIGYGANQTGYFSFHQMGSCRMGSRPANSVVNGAGETHAVKRLFVADGSLFPSASGVNPMITIAALAHYVSQQIKATL